MERKSKRKKDRSFYIFIALYAVSFFGMVIISLLSGSFFAHEILDSLWAGVLSLLFLSVLYITAFASEVRDSRKPADITINAFVFLGSLLFAVLMLIFGGVLTFAALLYSAFTSILLAVGWALKARKQDPSRHKPKDD